MIKIITIEEFNVLDRSEISYRDSLKYPTALANFERDRPEIDYQNIDWPSGHTEGIFGQVTFFRR